MHIWFCTAYCLLFRNCIYYIKHFTYAVLRTCVVCFLIITLHQSIPIHHWWWSCGCGVIYWPFANSANGQTCEQVWVHRQKRRRAQYWLNNECKSGRKEAICKITLYLNFFFLPKMLSRNISHRVWAQLNSDSSTNNTTELLSS